MKPKKGSASGPEVPESESAQNLEWATISEEDVLNAERKITAHVTASMAIWAASLEICQTMVRDWTASRQDALRKSMSAMMQIQSGRPTEEKAERAADVLIEQWSSFQKDFLALQMKTAAKANALLGKASEITRKADTGTGDAIRDSLKMAGEGFVRTDQPAEK